MLACWLPIVTNPCRAPPLFVAISSETDPLPVPLGVATRIHDWLLVAVQAQPSAAVTTIVTMPPSSATSALAGFNEEMQLVGALCTIRNDWLPIVSVSVRVSDCWLAATVSVAAVSPWPDPGEKSAHATSVRAVHVQLDPMVTVTVNRPPAHGIGEGTPEMLAVQPDGAGAGEGDGDGDGVGDGDATGVGLVGPADALPESPPQALAMTATARIGTTTRICLVMACETARDSPTPAPTAATPGRAPQVPVAAGDPVGGGFLRRGSASAPAALQPRISYTFDGRMYEISVSHREGAVYGVTVDDGRGTTTHAVTVWPSDVQRYAPGAMPEELLEASFRFLLEREPKESILRRFDVPVIERYFPEYPKVIAGMVTRRA
jgi:hypothetical protein